MKQKWILKLLLVCSLCLQYQTYSIAKEVSKEDYWSIFNTLTESDEQTLSLYKDLYTSRINHNSEKRSRVPKTIHFIWIGPKEFPEESIGNIKSWITQNPSFKYSFWTDRKRSNLPEGLTIRMIDSIMLRHLMDEYSESKNYAEKSDLLRYEILFQEGGIYVDHDVECFQSFVNLVDKFDFFSGLEPPHSPMGDSMLTVCNNIIGAVPKHPILGNTIKRVKNNWGTLRKLYEGEKPDTLKKRVFYSTFLPFSDTVTKYMDSSEYCNVVFPPTYFNNIGESKGLYAHHQYASTWFENETKFEKLVRKRLIKIAKKSNLILLISSVFFLINVILFIIIFLYLNKLKNRYLSSG